MPLTIPSATALDNHSAPRAVNLFPILLTFWHFDVFFWHFGVSLFRRFEVGW
jgi:hypothetical protein